MRIPTLQIEYRKTFAFGFGVAILAVLVLALRMNLDWLYVNTSLNLTHMAVLPLFFVSFTMIVLGFWFNGHQDKDLGLIVAGLGLMSFILTVVEAFEPFQAKMTVGGELIMLFAIYLLCATLLIWTSTLRLNHNTPTST